MRTNPTTTVPETVPPTEARTTSTIPQAVIDQYRSTIGDFYRRYTAMWAEWLVAAAPNQRPTGRCVSAFLAERKSVGAFLAIPDGRFRAFENEIVKVLRNWPGYPRNDELRRRSYRLDDAVTTVWISLDPSTAAQAACERSTAILDTTEWTELMARHTEIVTAFADLAGLPAPIVASDGTTTTPGLVPG